MKKKSYISPAQHILDSIAESAQDAVNAFIYGPDKSETSIDTVSVLDEIKNNIDYYSDPEEKLKYIINYIPLDENRLQIIGTLCKYIGINRTLKKKSKPINGDHLTGMIEAAVKESEKVFSEIKNTNILNYYRLNKDYIYSLGPLPPEIKLLDEIYKTIFLEIEMITTKDILQSIIDEYVQLLEWDKDKQILMNEFLIFHERGRIEYSEDGIIITDHDPYRFIIGLIEYWEKNKYIPEIKKGKNDRIINNFKWRTPKFKIESFKPDTLDSRRGKNRAPGLQEIENLLSGPPL